MGLLKDVEEAKERHRVKSSHWSDSHVTGSLLRWT